MVTPTSRTATDCPGSDPWLDPSRVRSAAVMVQCGPGKVRGGPGRSVKVREVVFEILNCLKNLFKKYIVVLFKLQYISVMEVFTSHST